MRTRRTLIISFVASVLLLAVGGVGYAYQSSHQKIDTVAELNQACHRNKDKDGYGNVTMAGGNFSNQKGIIAVDCKIRLKPGSTLQLRNIQLETKDFVVFDFPKDPKTAQASKSSHVILNRVAARGKSANFQINLGNPASSAEVTDSKFDYTNSLVVGTGEGDADNKASLSILRNTMRSTGAESKGVILVTTGKATFIDNKFEVSDSIGAALLLGNSCEFRNNTNANDRCQPDQ